MRLLLVTTIYSSLLHALCTQSITVCTGRFLVTESNIGIITPIVAFESVAAEMAAARITEKTVLLLLPSYMLWALPSNGHYLQSHRLAKGLYATLLLLLLLLLLGVFKLVQDVFLVLPSELGVRRDMTSVDKMVAAESWEGVTYCK
jgi:hypothetical protein